MMTKIADNEPRRYTGYVAELRPQEVFVFGSNLAGFHGAGSAGFAMRGESRNTWRSDSVFCDIVAGRTTDKRGLWAVYGVGSGFQSGLVGMSYAIPTVERPGFKGKVTLDSIRKDLTELCVYARSNPELTFLVVKLGATRAEGGFSYFGVQAIKDIWTGLDVPPNIILPKEQDSRVSDRKGYHSSLVKDEPDSEDDLFHPGIAY